ncbi:MAG: DHHA1 domain-containing protein, partial [Candidatus Neomarinimicrobiota bacterium]
IIKKISSYDITIRELKKIYNISELKDLGDQLLSEISSGIGVVGAKGEKTPNIVIVVSDDLIQKEISAVELSRAIGEEMGTGGGGRPHLAITGARDNNQLRALLNQANTHILHVLKTLK